MIKLKGNWKKQRKVADFFAVFHFFNHRIIKIASIVMLFFFIAIAPSYAQPTEIWRATYDFSLGAPPNLYPARDEGLKIGTDADGNVYVAVSSAQWLDRTTDNPVEYYIFKYDTDGNEQWHSWVGYGSLVDFHVDPPGNVYCAYSSNNISGGTGQDANIIKINSDGSSAWSKTWNNSTVNQADWPIAIDIDSGGNVYVLIKSQIGTGWYKSVILKYNPDGNFRWEETGPTPPRDIDVDNAGNAYVLYYGAVRKYRSSDGALLCSEVVQYWWDDDGSPGNPTYWADADGVDIEVGPDGNVYIAGTAEQRHWFWTGSDWDSEYHLNFFTAKYDNGCNLVWRDEYGSYEEEDYPRKLVFDNDGNILVTGPSANQLATLKYLPDGTRAGIYQYSTDDAPGFYIDGAYAYVIEVDQYSPPYRALRKYLLSTAAEQWALPLDDLLTATDLVVAAGEILYLTGSVHDGEAHQPVTSGYANDMVLVKYISNGQCEGNFDTDGDVDGSDLAVFAADFGRTDCDTGEPCEGDFDEDGDVDGSDLAVFATDFGRTDCP